jgi:hypothetical protein
LNLENAAFVPKFGLISEMLNSLLKKRLCSFEKLPKTKEQKPPQPVKSDEIMGISPFLEILLSKFF